jgi:hypothetical protein
MPPTEAASSFGATSRAFARSCSQRMPASALVGCGTNKHQNPQNMNQPTLTSVTQRLNHFTLAQFALRSSTMNPPTPTRRLFALKMRGGEKYPETQQMPQLSKRKLSNWIGKTIEKSFFG